MRDSNWLRTTAAKNLSVLCGALLIPFFALAESSSTAASPTYEAALVLPWNFVQQSISSYTRSNPGPIQFDLGPQTFDVQGTPITISGAHVDVVMSVKPVQAVGAETLWQTEVLKTQISLPGVSITKTVEEIHNGVRVIVTVSAQCSPFILIQNQGQAQMRWQWSASSSGDSLRADLKSFDLNWPANSWQVSQLICQGPNGFGELVQAELQKQLAQPDAIAALAKTYLQTAVSNQLNQNLGRWRKPTTVSAEGQPVSLVLSGTQTLTSKGLLFSGLLRVGTKAPSRNDQFVPLQATEALYQKVGSQPTLIISKKSVESLVAQKNLWPQSTVSLNKISAFQDLLSNRFIQFFIWPDLFNYSTTSPFNLISEVQGSPKIVLGTQNNATVQAPVSSWIVSKRENRSWYYLHLKSQVSGNMTYGVSKGTFNVTLKKSNVKSEVGFGVDYLKAFYPNTFISTSTIQDAVNQASTVEKRSITIPLVQVFDGLKLRAESMSRPSENFFFVNWAVVP